MKKFKLFVSSNRKTTACNDATMVEFAAFLTSLAKARKMYSVTVWHNADGNERGFCVWYH